MNRISLTILLGFGLGLCLTIFGCGRQSKAPAKPAEESVGAAKPTTAPFLGDDQRPASDRTVDNLQPLYRMGPILLLAGAVVGVWFWSFFLGASIAGGGLLGVFAAVLLSEFPRSSLLLPIVGLGLLAFWAIGRAIRFFAELWREHKAFPVVTEKVEELDTGPNSPGRKIKRAIDQSGKGGIVSRGIKHLKSRLKRTHDDAAG